MATRKVHIAKLPRLHSKLCDVFEHLLSGEPAVDKDGSLILIEGKPVYLAPKAAVLREVREFLKDNHIDEEPIEGSGIVEVARQVRHYDDEPLQIPERDAPSE